MTQADSSDEHARLLGNVVLGRSRMLDLIADGQYVEAIEIGQSLLVGIDEWLGAQEPTPLGIAQSPTTSQDVAILAQRAGLLADCSLAALGEGSGQQAQFFLSGLDTTNLTEFNYPILGNAGTDIFMYGQTFCIHGRRTYDPDGACFMKPPCMP